MRNLLLIPGLLLMLCLSGCGRNVGATQGGRPPTQVVALPAQEQAVAETLSLIGSVLANEMVEIKAEIDGRVEEVLFREGESVTNGQLLLRLDDSKLIKEVAEARANFQLRKSTHERDKELHAGQLISTQEFDQSYSLFQSSQALLDLVERRLRDTRIVAPFDGVMGARSVSPGQVIAQNTILTWVVDLTPVKVEINVPERFLGQLRLGQAIAVRIDAYPDEEFQGKVFFISPYVDPNLRTALVKAEVPNPDGRLKPGMFANLDLTLRIREKAVVVPESALARIFEGDKGSVFVVSNQTAQMRQVSLGVRLPGRVEVTKGLAAGEEVVVEGVQKLGPNAPVTLAPPEAAAPYQQ